MRHVEPFVTAWFDDGTPYVVFEDERGQIDLAANLRGLEGTCGVWWGDLLEETSALAAALLALVGGRYGIDYYDLFPHLAARLAGLPEAWTLTLHQLHEWCLAGGALPLGLAPCLN
jgi:hypothetical protein